MGTRNVFMLKKRTMSASLFLLQTRHYQVPRRIKTPETEQNTIEKMLGKAVYSIKDDFSQWKYILKDPRNRRFRKSAFPFEADFLIIGGGPIGCSIAYWLKERCRKDLIVTLVEKDMEVKHEEYNNLKYEEYALFSTIGEMKQQFSVKEHIELAQFGTEFFRNVSNDLQIPTLDPIDVDFTPFGYLTLASSEGVEALNENYNIQRGMGVKNEILTPYQMNQRFPWLHTEGIELGLHGLQNEGWIDAWKYLLALRTKSITYGLNLIDGELVGFNLEYQPDIYVQGWPIGRYCGTNEATIRLPNGDLRTIQFSQLIIAAGAETGKITKEMLGIKNGNEHHLHFEVPIESRRRYIYSFTAPPGGPGVISPMIVDRSGVYFRRQGVLDRYVCGRLPQPNDPPEIAEETNAREFFNKYIWPILAYRVPTFEHIQMLGHWVSDVDYNTFDQTGIVGPHPAYININVASGFGHNSVQLSPGIGRAVTEYFLERAYATLDLHRLNFNRVVLNEPLYENLIC